MHEQGRSKGWRISFAVFFVGLGLGWAGASWRATHELRDRDAADIEVRRQRLEAEEMRLLDLNSEQRQHFLEAKQYVYNEMRRVLGRSRPEIEGIIRQGDQKIRPTLSPRQLAVYDQLESRYRLTLPESPVGADD